MSFAQVTTNYSLPAISRGAIEWADYNQDGYPDLFLCGQDSSQAPYTAILRNDSATGFTAVASGLPQLYYSTGAWGDYDNDGDPDLVISGRLNRKGTFAGIYRNDSSLGFTALSVNLLGLEQGTADWVDLDSDGDLDLLMTGFDMADLNQTLLYRNDGNHSFTLIKDSMFALVVGSCSGFSDYDLDGDTDLFLAGLDNSGALAGGIYRNEGGFSFSYQSFNLPAVEAGAVDFGDLDGDQIPELVITGFEPNYFSGIYSFKGGYWTSYSATLPDLAYSAAAFGDFDGDQDLDLVVSGRSLTGDNTIVYRNTGSGNLVNTNSILTGLLHSKVSWGDFDQDNELEFAISGEDGSGKKYTMICEYNASLGRFQP